MKFKLILLLTAVSTATLSAGAHANTLCIPRFESISYDSPSYYYFRATTTQNTTTDKCPSWVGAKVLGLSYKLTNFSTLPSNTLPKRTGYYGGASTESEKHVAQLEIQKLDTRINSNSYYLRVVVDANAVSNQWNPILPLPSVASYERMRLFVSVPPAAGDLAVGPDLQLRFGY